jgi:hypothetical protein
MALARSADCSSNCTIEGAAVVQNCVFSIHALSADFGPSPSLFPIDRA